VRSELPPSHDFDTDAGAPTAGEGIIDPGGSNCALRFVKAAECACGKKPFVEPLTSVPEGCLETLTLTGAETVEGHREVVDPNT
jgi:hypothetical protein